MFDDLGYFTRVELGMLKILEETIIAKGFKICDLYILEGCNNFIHSSSSNEEFHENNKLWDLRSRHGGCMKVV